MRGGWAVVAEFWRDRHAWLWPPLLGVALALALSLSQPQLFTAAATLQLDVSQAKAPLLQHWNTPGHQQILSEVLHRPELLADSARDSGQPLDPAGLDLAVVNERLLTLRYSSPRRAGLEAALDALAFNFIYELLAPERLRLEQRLQTVTEQLKQAEAPADDPAQQNPRQARLDELRKLYNQTMADLASVNAAFDKGSPNALLWFAEPAHLTQNRSPLARHLNAALGGLMAGLLAAMLLVGLRQLRRGTQATQDNLAALTGLPLLGQLPDLGAAALGPGKVEVEVGGTTVQPTGFAEIVRLHRLLTRNLKGALVVTCVDGGEGSSLLSQLLALRSAVTAKSVLLVDLNLKSSLLTRANGARPAPWKLGEKSRKGAEAWREAIVGLGDSGVDFLPAPSDHASLRDLATVANAQAWLDRVADSYEHIIIDTSPLSALNRGNADPQALGAAAARTALVVLTGATPKKRLQQAVPQLLAGGANVIGVVANVRFDPAPRVLVRQALNTLGGFAPGLAQWLTARAGV
jgi:Mrp family chromosome partitioning ATPase